MTTLDRRFVGMSAARLVEGTTNEYDYKGVRATAVETWEPCGALGTTENGLTVWRIRKPFGVGDYVISGICAICLIAAALGAIAADRGLGTGNWNPKALRNINLVLLGLSGLELTVFAIWRLKFYKSQVRLDIEHAVAPVVTSTSINEGVGL